MLMSVVLFRQLTNPYQNSENRHRFFVIRTIEAIVYTVVPKIVRAAMVLVPHIRGKHPQQVYSATGFCPPSIYKLDRPPVT